MKTAAEREKAFVQELAELLAKHKAEITLDTRFKDFYSYQVAVVTFDGVWDKDGNVVEEFHEFDLLS